MKQTQNFLSIPSQMLLPLQTLPIWFIN